ncbi:MAG: HEAT repeat domain-containing protein [Ilumatobacter sp.]
MSDPEQTAAARRRAAAVAGHSGDTSAAREALSDADPKVRATALGALERLGALDDPTLSSALSDVDSAVRRRAASVAATHPGVDLGPLLDDADPKVVEVAAWACGEHESDRDAIVERLIELGTHAEEPLVRESAVAALGAIGDLRALDTVVAATQDKPAVRRRAVLALAPFIDDPHHGDVVDATIERALTDRDWQVRQAAEDLRRVTGA